MRALVLFLTLAAAAHAQTGARDRYFTKYPFDRWLSAGEHNQIRWNVRIPPAKLTPHQRLSARIEVLIEPKETGKRRGHGEIATLLQIEDSTGKRWRSHNIFDLSAIASEAAPAQGLLYSQEAFLVPGDYTFSVATVDSQTGEYSFTRRPFHVSPLRNDPIPGLAKNLPPVEFVRVLEGPAAWFQPYERTRLRLPVANEHQVHLDLILNLTPSERAAGTTRIRDRNMAVLIPTLKVLADLQLEGVIDIALLDLTRREVHEQKNARGLDWETLRSSLAAGPPGIIDRDSLAARGQMTRFLRDQVATRAQAEPGAPHMILVLSASSVLGHQEPLEPFTLPPDPNRRIFYLRYRPIPRRPPLGFNSELAPPPPGPGGSPFDDLEHVLKPFDVRILNATTPEDFRKAIAAIMAELRRM